MEDKKGTEEGWVTSFLNGSIGSDLGKIKSDNPDTNFTLESKEDLWYNGMNDQFTSQYGDSEAHKKFDEFYSSMERSYSDYQVGNFHAKKLTKPWVSEADAWAYHGQAKVNHDLQSGQVLNPTVSGATEQFRGITEELYDNRKDAIDKNVLELEDGTLLKGDAYDAVDNENYVNSKGKKIKGIYYDPEASSNPLYRGDNHLKAIYYDEPLALGSEGVSKLDYYGISTPSVDSKTWIGSTVDGVYDGFIGILSSLSSLGEAGTAAIGFDDSMLNDWFEGNASMYNSLKTSSSKYAQSNPWAAENLFHMTGEIVSQFAGGAGAGMASSGLARILGASLKNASRIGSGTSAFVMGVHGAGDMYSNARSHGFSASEAGWLHLLTAGAMIGLNKSFGLADDMIGSVRANKAFKKNIMDDLAYMSSVAKPLNEITKKESKKRIASIVSNAAKKTQNYLANSKGYITSGIKEPSEEISEFITEESIKQLANSLKYAFDDDGNIELGKGRFMTVTDEGYWDGIAEGITMSAVGGFLGGNIAKAIQGNKTLEQNSNKLVDIIMDGRDKDYLKVIDDLHATGELGPKALSTERNETNDGWLPSTEGRMSMNDANKQVLLQQYNHVRSVIDGLGGKAAANALLEFNPEIREQLDNTSLTSDIKSLTKEYIDLQTKSDIALDLVVPIFKEGYTEEDLQKEIKKHQEVNATVDPDVIKRAVEIKKELHDIRTGRYSEKYLAQIQTKGTVLDPTTKEGIELTNEFGTNLYTNLLDDAQESYLNSKTTAARNKVKLEENTKLVDGLKKDLSNIKDIESLFDLNVEINDISNSIKLLEQELTDPKISEDSKANTRLVIDKLNARITKMHESSKEKTQNYSPLSKESVEKLKEKLSEYEPSGKDINTIKKIIQEEVKSSGIYSRESIKNSIAYKSLVEKNPAEKDKLLDFMYVYYNARIEKQLEKANSIIELEDLKVEKVSNLFQHIDMQQIMGIMRKSPNSLSYALKQENMEEAAKFFVESVSKEEFDYGLNLKFDPARRFGNIKESVNEVVSNYKSLENILQLIGDSKPTKVKELESEINTITKYINENDLSDTEESGFRDIISMMSRRISAIENYEHDTSSLDHFTKNFTGDKESIVSTSDINTTIKSISNLIESSRLPNGESTFNDVDIVSKTLKAAKVRKAQLESFIGPIYKNDKGELIRGAGIIDGLSKFRTRNQKILSGSLMSSSQLAEDIKLDNESTYKLDNILFNIEEYNSLKQKEKPSYSSSIKSGNFWKRKSKVKEGVKPSQSTLTSEERDILNSMEDKLLNSYLTVNKLNDYIDTLESQLEIAKAGNDSTAMISNHKDSVGTKVKHDIETIHDILVTSGLADNLDSADSSVSDFMQYKGNLTSDGYNSSDKSDKAIIMDYSKIIAVTDYLYSLEDSKKRNISEKLYNYYKLKNETQRFMDAVTFMYHSLSDFDAAYKYLISTMDNVPSMDQKTSAYYVSAHMNSEVANVIYDILPGRDFNDVLSVYGVGGAGKSKMVMGVGAKIGQFLQSNKFGSENTKVLLASNHQDQIDIIKDSANKVGLHNTKSINSLNGLNLDQLLFELENNNNISDVSTIIYDEATFIQLGPETDNYDNKKPLSKILDRIKFINESRGKDKPKLKLVLMGDPNQNGALNEDGVSDNISGYKKVYKPAKLTYSFRAKVPQLLSVLDNIDNIPYRAVQGGVGVTNLKSEYGIINQDKDQNLLGGVRFLNPSESISDVIENAKFQIELAREAKSDKFTVGIATNGELSPELKAFVEEYPNNVKAFTHEGIQGQEFDYVIGVINREVFGNEILKPYKEEILGKKLTTTIGRAKYFAAMINETERVFSSKLTDNVTMSSTDYVKSLADQMKGLMDSMIENITEIPEGEIVKVNLPQPVEDDIEIEEKTSDELKKVPTLETPPEEIESIEELEVKREDLIKSIEEGRGNKEDLKEIDDKIIIKEGLNKIDLEESEEIEDEGGLEVLDNEVSDTNLSFKEKAAKDRAILKDLESKGIITSYSRNTTLPNTEDITQNINTLTDLFGSDKVVEAKRYEEVQIKAMGLRRKNGYKGFDYDLVIHQSNPGFYHMNIVATEKATSKKVIVSSLPFGTLKSSELIGGDITNRAIDLVNLNGGKMFSMPIKNINRLIKEKGKGKISYGYSRNQVDLDTFFNDKINTLNPNLFISNKVFINTNVDSSWRGEAFLLYSYDDINNMSSKNLKRLTDRAVSTYSEEGIYGEKSFKNGLGIIRLDNKPSSLKDLFSLYDSTSSSVKSLYDVVNPRKGHTNMVEAFSQINEIINAFHSKIYTDGEIKPEDNHVTREIFKRTIDKQYDKESGIVLVDYLSTLYKVNKPLYLDFIRILNDITDVEAVTNTVSEPRVNKRGETWPVFKKHKGAIMQYASADSLGEVEKPMDNYRFDIMNFFKAIDNLGKEGKNTDDIIKTFSDILGLSRSFKNGLYLKPNILRAGKRKGNRSFADIQNLPGLNKTFNISVESISKPPIYLDGHIIKDILSPENVQKENEPKSIKSNKGKNKSEESPFLVELNAHLETLKGDLSQSELNNISSKIEDIKEAIKESTDSRSIKSKALKRIKDVEKVVKNKLKELLSNKKIAVSSKVVKSQVTTLKKSVKELPVIPLEEATPEILKYKTRLTDYVNRLERSIPFIITPNSLTKFIADLEGSMNDSDLYLQRLLDKDLISLSQLDKVAGDSKVILEGLKSKVLSRPEDMWVNIESNMNSTIDSNNLPTEAKGELDTLDIASLLVMYHRYKNSNDIDNLNKVRGLIEMHNPNYKESVTTKISRITNSDIFSKEDLEEAVFELKALSTENNISVDNNIKVLFKRFKEFESLSNSTNLEDTIESLPESSTKENLKAINEDTLEENLSTQGTEVINSSLEVFNKFVSSELDTEAKINSVKDSFNEMVKSERSNLEKKLRFVRHKDQKDTIINMFNDKVTEVFNIIESKMSKIEETKIDINPYVATKEKMLPDFKNKTLDTTGVTEGMTNLMNNFIMANDKGTLSSLDTWIKAINGDLSEVNQANINAKGDLVQDLISIAGTDLESVEKLITFQQQKEHDNTCK